MEELINKFVSGLISNENYNKEYSKIYRYHKYWARKPWYIIDQFIKQYSKTGDLVLDPFCGSGSTGVESIVNNRNFIGYDLNPIALMVSDGTMDSNVDIESLHLDFMKIKAECKNPILNLYRADESCENCGETLYFKHIVIGPKCKGEFKGQVYCGSCNKRPSVSKRLLNNEEIQAMNNLRNIEIPYWYPKKHFPEKFYKDRFSYKGIQKVSDMYTNRNLLGLSMLLNSINKPGIKNKKLLILAFTNTVLHASKLKGENVRPLGVNNYWIPDDYIEENVWFRFNDRFKQLLNSKVMLQKRLNEKNTEVGNYNLVNDSALSLKLDKQVDYIFTDPPYGDAIQYSELSFIWNAWIDKEYNNEEEIIINPVQEKGPHQFNELLTGSITKMYESLKDEGYFTLCFQNKDSSIWEKVIESCKQIGFTLEDIGIFDTFGNSYNNNWAKFSPKADIYVTFKKTKKLYKERFFDEDTDLKTLIKNILDNFESHSLKVDLNKLYDVTIAMVIWHLYYNESVKTIDTFTTKTFQKIVEEIQSSKILQEKKIKDKENKLFQMKLF